MVALMGLHNFGRKVGSFVVEIEAEVEIEVP